MIQAFLALVPALLSPAGEITWQNNWDKTLAQAAAEKKVIFLAVNMDGERANERMLEKVYTDKTIQELATHTLNLVACGAEHVSLEKDCPRFHGLKCLEHRRIDMAARKDVLKQDAQGWVVAPQHVFLGPDGKVLLSVPYEISAAELAWCFVTALDKADPEARIALPSGAHMPRRVIVGGVFDPTKGAPAGQPPTTKELVELIKQARKGIAGEQRNAALRCILLSDDPQAVEFIGQELKSGEGGGGGKGGGGGGGKGSGAGIGAGGGGGGSEKHAKLLHAIGASSPPVYWSVVLDFLERAETNLRAEAVVALEQLGAPESLKALDTALAKEKDPAIQKDILRALGTCGAADEHVHMTLLKRAKSEKNETNRLNAIVALGWLEDDAQVKEFLTTTLSKGVDVERSAAALAAGLSRKEFWVSVLTQCAKEERTDDVRRAIETASATIQGGDLSKLGPLVKSVCKDTIERERFFGRGLP